MRTTNNYLMVLGTAVMLVATACGSSSGSEGIAAAGNAGTGAASTVEAAPPEAQLDGTYRWTVTKDDALTHGLPGDKKPESLATFPWVFTMTMGGGTWELRHHDETGDVDDGGGTFTVDGDRIAFVWQKEGYEQQYTFSADSDGTLHLHAQPPINPGDQFVWATNPWAKIADAGTTTADATPSSSAPASVAGDGSTYSTKTFDLPFDVDIPQWLEARPAEEQAAFVTWQGTVDPGRKVRFLIPVNVYPPGASATTATPKDFVAYLLGQADHGAHFADVAETTVDGHPATIVTATVDDSLDGSLGCPEVGMSAADCFGLQPDFVLRVAVIDAGDQTLLVWLRNTVAGVGDMASQIEMFDDLLATVHFSDRAVEAPVATPVATALDGIYTWTITPDDALAHGTPGDKTHLAAFPSVFSIEMANGTWTFRDPASGSLTDEGGGTYNIDGDRVAFHWRGDTLTFAFSVDGDGTLHLDAVPPMNDGDQFIWSTEPWSKTS